MAITAILDDFGGSKQRFVADRHWLIYSWGILDDFGSCQTSYRWGFGEVNCDLLVNRSSNEPWIWMNERKERSTVRWWQQSTYCMYGFCSGLIGVTPLIHPMSQPARKNTNNAFAGIGFACHFATTRSEFLYIVRFPPKRPKLKETHVAFTANTLWWTNIAVENHHF